MIFNPWRPYPMWLPKKDGWYRCTIETFDDDIERKVMDLYFDASTESWRDNRRQQVFDGYKVYKSGREAMEYNRVHSDRLCARNDVVAWKKIERPCRWWKRKESHKGYTPSEETRRKIAEGNRGKHLSEETKKKIGDANRGRRASLETRRRMSESSRCKRKVLCVETGIIYNSIRDAAKDVGTPASNVGSVCTGKTKTAGGYSWKYVE